MTNSEARTLAEAILLIALKDVKEGNPEEQLQTLMWFASQKSSVWLDILDIDHITFLTAIQWNDRVLALGPVEDLPVDIQTLIEEVQAKLF